MLEAGSDTFSLPSDPSAERDEGLEPRPCGPCEPVVEEGEPVSAFGLEDHPQLLFEQVGL